MTVPITNSGILPESIVTPASRYKNQIVIYWGELNLLTFNTYLRVKYVPVGDEKVMLITKGIEYRPDLVSQQVYGFPDNWWRIMEANNIFDILNFKAGITILIPNLTI